MKCANCGCDPCADVNPGCYYAEKDRKRREICAKLDAAHARNAPEAEIERLERELFRASYTGD